MLNLEGDQFVQDIPPQKVIDRTTGFLEACDMACMDFYAKNRNADAIRSPTSGKRWANEHWSKGKPAGAFIECSNQHIGEKGRGARRRERCGPRLLAH